MSLNDPSSSPPGEGRPIFAASVVVFAGVILAIVGVFQIFQGVVAVFDDGFYVVTRNYTFDLDTTAWGWIHIVVGLLAVGIAAGLLSGAMWARIAAVTVATLSALVNFLWIPYFPVWAIVIIALDLLIIWGVTQYKPDDVVV